jgi:hypothetical protein
MLIKWKVHNSRYLEEVKAFSSRLISKEKSKHKVSLDRAGACPEGLSRRIKPPA